MKSSFIRIYDVVLREMLVALLIKLSCCHEATGWQKIEEVYIYNVEDHITVEKYNGNANLL